LPHNGQVVDDYPAFMLALLLQGDEGIYFGKELCAALRKYGLEIADRYRRRFSAGPPKIAQPIFTMAQDQGLMPSDASYADWEQGFPEKN
jgi:hypothetical protein